MPNETEVPQVWTVQVMADQLKAHETVIEAIISMKGIKHVAECGYIRIFSNEAVAQVRHELNARAARRSSPKQEGL